MGNHAGTENTAVLFIFPGPLCIMDWAVTHSASPGSLDWLCLPQNKCDDTYHPKLTRPTDSKLLTEDSTGKIILTE